MIALALEGISLRELREDWDTRDIDTAFDLLTERAKAAKGRGRSVDSG